MSVQYIEPDQLAQWIDEDFNSVIVVDVRDIDYSGYKIPGSRHIPYNSFSKCIPALIASIKALPTLPKRIVFHCKYRSEF